MKKSEALALFDNMPSRLARAIGVNRQAITNWPDELSDYQRDRVQAALWRRHAGNLFKASKAMDVPTFMADAAALVRDAERMPEELAA